MSITGGKPRGGVGALALAVLLLLSARSASAHGCTGDCDGDDTITVSELVRGVRIALVEDSILNCPQFDVDSDFRVSIDELMVAVNNAFNYCGHGSPPTPTPTPTP
jgi:hypothetical protein